MAEDELWEIRVTVPMRLPVEARHALFSAVAEAVADWEPEDRDGWDADVSGCPQNERQLHAPPTSEIAGELVLSALAAVRCIPDGEIKSGCTVHDGGKVRDRLRLAVLAAKDALNAAARP